MILKVASAVLFGRQMLIKPKGSAAKSKRERYGSTAWRSHCPRAISLATRKVEWVVSGDGMDYIHIVILSACTYINKNWYKQMYWKLLFCLADFMHHPNERLFDTIFD